MPHKLRSDPSTRRARITGWLTFAFAAILVACVAYFGYVGYEGSRQLTDPPGRSADCRTPALLGWAYEPINYDGSMDVAMASEPDPQACIRQGPRAGTELAAADGVGLAGWYVPSASGAGPTRPTVVLAHGWGSNKSAMLDRAAILHEAYNLVLFDFRNHGQSAPSPTTQGVREAADVRALLDWLERTKGPERVAVLGVSMGGATALAAADRDERVDALIVESTHATLAGAAQARLSVSGYPLAMPASWAILLGALIRTGEDMSSIDPLQSVERLDGRPLLLVYGGADNAIGATDAEDLRAAAEAAGNPVELRVCADAGHARSPDECPRDYAAWVLGFLERVLGPAG